MLINVYINVFVCVSVCCVHKKNIFQIYGRNYYFQKIFTNKAFRLLGIYPTVEERTVKEWGDDIQGK